MLSLQSLDENANNLLKCLLSTFDATYGLGHMTSSIYDTAWVSMVKKNDEWLFPSSFRFIVDRQASSGGWESPSAIDSILNSLSSLLSLKLHSVDGSYSTRISNAEYFLASQLSAWDVTTTERVGFEIIVPVLLSALSKEGIEFSFPQRDILMDLHNSKISKIKPEMLYRQQTSVLHSLEGLIGHIDFDKVGHHKRHGSFMASPSSTAAYLMHSSKWDDECEAYLNEVISRCAINGEGSVPSAWPTTYFELSWIVCTLHDGGFNLANLDRECLDQVSAILKNGIESENGVIGFASDVGADADDSAKVILALHHLGVTVPVDALCRVFELEAHFRCYAFERNPSVTVQCNVLSTLLAAAEADASTGLKTCHASILKVVAFISEYWWTTNKDIEDKWHNSGYYPLLLVTQCLTKFMILFDKGFFADFPIMTVQTKVPITLFNILVRILQAQRSDDGSWGSCEETAYALLSLTSLSSLPFVSIMIPTIQLTVDRGHHFLMNNSSDKLDTRDEVCLWIDKVNYRIPPISCSYVLAALHSTSTPISNVDSTVGEISRIIPIPSERVKGFLRFYRKMALFHACQDWQLLAYLVEGYLYVPILEDVRTTISGREGMDKEPYIEYIPFSWTSANAMLKKYSCPQNCFVLMTISLLVFQVDEFFDLMVRDDGTAALPTLRQALDDIFDALHQGKDITGMTFDDGPYAHMVHYMHRCICFIINYPTSQRASYYDKTHLRRELKAYLLSMIKQTEDNTVYAAQSSWDTFITPNSSYLKWVRTLGSENVSGLCCSSFFICHLSPDLDVFPTPELKFIAQDCITHLCVLCRIWNDWGSMKRDITERNINGMNFPEFAGMDESAVKAEMRKISDYERRCLHASLKELREKAKELMGDAKGDTWMDALDLFFRGADVYNAIYELKDISAWKLSLINAK